MRRHPSQRRLESWLEGTDDDVALDEHITSCDRCAAAIEALAVTDDPIQTALHRVLAPPSDLRIRVGAGIESRLQNRADLTMLAGLMGVGMRTVRLMMDQVGDERDVPATPEEGHAE